MMTSDDYYSTADTEVGLMIEGRYCWNEYCHEHGKAYLRVHPERQSRSITISEVCASWRNYRCYACNRILWDRNRASDDEGPIDPFVRRTGSTVVEFKKAKTEEPA
jgi:hypothetical protein